MSGKKILIVEDNDLNMKLFKDLVESHGCTTVETSDGAEAMKLTEDELPDLIIMDIQLPHISGIDIIKNIKAKKHLKHIPIIAVTAFAMEEDKEKILAAGCESYIAKPISIDKFVAVIEKYLGDVKKVSGVNT